MEATGADTLGSDCVQVGDVGELWLSPQEVVQALVEVIRSVRREAVEYVASHELRYCD